MGDSGVTPTAGQINVKEIRIKLPDGISCDAAGFVASSGVTCETETEQGVDVVESKMKVAGPILVGLRTLQA